MNASGPVSAIRVQSALLAREYEATATGDSLIGVFTSVTPLGNLDDGRWSETDCYVFLQLFGAQQGDAIELHLVDGDDQRLQKYSFRLERGFNPTTPWLPYGAVLPLRIPHYTYGPHRLVIDHVGVELGNIPFDVRPMPRPF